jgi:uncharacterized protein (DUF4415 family)
MPANPYRPEAARMARANRLSRTARLQLERLQLNAAGLAREDMLDYNVQALVPEAWDTLEQDLDVFEPKTKITLRLDDSVAKFYRAMGEGYQARINRILATFAQMRIAQVRRLEEMLEAELSRVQDLRPFGGVSTGKGLSEELSRVGEE